ncbi:cytochrome P450 76T24-like [Cryptomeria japonica]|uniref:cytochrome P450 76T24-like n=1 Tax=Cryptomeria japonica TaxID=3369 RepID=UPI0027DA3010|nr:cytochrome P450 76T24-like [Cryptomeria japonica]
MIIKTKHLKGVYDFVDLILQKRLASVSQSLERNDSKKDFLDVLLDFRSEDFNLVDIRALITVSTEKTQKKVSQISDILARTSYCGNVLQDLFVAGTETTTTTIESAMAEFIHNPQKLNRVRQELDDVVGCNRRVEESDLDHLPYLNAAVKEIFRLHPTVPLLLPHKAESSCVIGGFVVPKNSQVILNVWAIGMDPAIWKRPSEFVPQRFLEGENSRIDYRGQNFELIPFGSGRRICPGLPLASRMINFVLASLLHSFEWKLPDETCFEQMDMAEEFGVTLKKGVELKAIPVPRLPHHLY